MKKKIFRNLGLKIGAILFATLVWLAVTNTIDPSITKTINGIPIEITNENALTSKNKVYSVNKNNKKASIKIKGRRSLVEKLTKNDFEAKAPLDEMSIVDAVPVYVSANKEYIKNTVEIVEKTNSITVKIEDITKQTYDIQVNYEGEPAEGYCKEKVKLSQTQVTVSAPESIQKTINNAAITMNVSGCSTDVAGKYSVKLYKVDGTEIEANDNLKLNLNTIEATQTILQYKQVPIQVSYTGVPEEGYEDTYTFADPGRVSIMGRAEDLDKVTTIKIPKGEIDITGAKSKVTKKINIVKYLPEGCQLSDADQAEIEAGVGIEALVSKIITINQSDIRLKNVPHGMKVTFTKKDSIKIKLGGFEPDLNSLSKDTLRPTLDFTDLEEGDATLKLQVTLPDGVTSDNVKVSVRLTKED